MAQYQFENMGGFVCTDGIYISPTQRTPQKPKSSSCGKRSPSRSPARGKRSPSRLSACGINSPLRSPVRKINPLAKQRSPFRNKLPVWSPDLRNPRFLRGVNGIPTSSPVRVLFSN